ncbi:MAG: hypothetical protein ACRYF5_05955, partial [Janthinobacterium lividum]
MKRKFWTEPTIIPESSVVFEEQTLLPCRRHDGQSVAIKRWRSCADLGSTRKLMLRKLVMEFIVAFTIVSRLPVR